MSPSSTSVEKGQTQNFRATVNGTNNPSQAVTWSVNSTKSSITPSGVFDGWFGRNSFCVDGNGYFGCRPEPKRNCHGNGKRKNP
ncbi:MAG: Ig-like domain-containing protein [Tannerella sp.]|nr:Ig-like domain-containing protein [Tannerella sp.]